MGVPGGTQLLQGASRGEGVQHTGWKLGEQPEAACPEQNEWGVKWRQGSGDGPAGFVINGIWAEDWHSHFRIITELCIQQPEAHPTPTFICYEPAYSLAVWPAWMGFLLSTDARHSTWPSDSRVDDTTEGDPHGRITQPVGNQATAGIGGGYSFPWADASQLLLIAI